MNLTLEKIELVKDRTGVSYKEAKLALEQTEGNVVDAIILIEENIDEASRSRMGTQGAVMLDHIKEAVRKGNVSRILVTKEDETLLNLPVNIGIIGTILFPWAVLGATLAALGTKCKVELIKDDGDIINISEKASDTFDTVLTKGSVIVDEVKDKGEDIVETAKEKSYEAWSAAVEKGSGVVDTVRDKAGERMKRSDADQNLDGLYDFDLGDVEDVIDCVQETVEEQEQE